MKNNKRALNSIQNVKHLLKDLVLGAVQIQPNANITFKGKVIKPTKGISDALHHIKFHYKFLVGYVGRRENGTPYTEFEFITLKRHNFLFHPDTSETIFSELRERFNKADHQTRLTTFWLASPNPDISEDLMLNVLLLLLQEYSVFDNMITQYEIATNKEVGRTLHSTTYWFNLMEFIEITYEIHETETLPDC